jgi:hypothetical protein
MARDQPTTDRKVRIRVPACAIRWELEHGRAGEDSGWTSAQLRYISVGPLPVKTPVFGSPQTSDHAGASGLHSLVSTARLWTLPHQLSRRRFPQQHPPFQRWRSDLPNSRRGGGSGFMRRMNTSWAREPHKSHVFVISKDGVSLGRSDRRAALRDVLAQVTCGDRALHRRALLPYWRVGERRGHLLLPASDFGSGAEVSVRASSLRHDFGDYRLSVSEGRCDPQTMFLHDVVGRRRSCAVGEQYSRCCAVDADHRVRRDRRGGWGRPRPITRRSRFRPRLGCRRRRQPGGKSRVCCEAPPAVGSPRRWSTPSWRSPKPTPSLADVGRLL